MEHSHAAKPDFGVYEKMVFVSDLLNKQVEIRNMLDMRSNIMIGFNSALVVFFIANFHDTLAKNVFFILGLVVVFASMFCAIMALKPSHFVTKKGQAESLFYHHYIASKELAEYRHDIYAALEHEHNIFNSYILETYNLTRFSNMPRKTYLNLSIRILIYGMAGSVGIYAISLILPALAKLLPN